MATTDRHKAVVWEDAGVTLMARITGVDASNITQSDVTSIGIKVFDLDGATPTTAIVNTTLVVADSVFDTLQTDARWTEDSTGYNFRTTLASTVCATGGHNYRVELLFTPATGQPYWVVYALFAQSVWSS